MRSLKFSVLFLMFCACALSPVWCEQITLDLTSLSKWIPREFPWQPRHSQYTPVATDAGPAIRIISDNASSSLEYDQSFETAKTPYLSWSWKAMNILANGNAATKEGDDYAVRVSVMFPYDPSHHTLLERMRYSAANRVLGYYPASEILSYVWANRAQTRNPMENAFSARGMMYFLDVGTNAIGQWRNHQVDIARDYRAAYHSAPPSTFTILIMGDTDNTHGSTTAYIRDIRLTSTP